MYSNTYPVFNLSEAAPNVRAAFIRKTYLHLAGAIGAFALLETVLLNLQITRELAYKVLTMPYGFLMVMGGFVLVGFLARSMATASTSKPVQYAGLGLYVILEAIIFVPLLLLALYRSGGGDMIAQAGIMTTLLFAGLTATVFITRKDFSFLGSILTVGGFIALGLIITGAIFGFNLGLWFSVGMVVLAAGAILYTTSNILNTYNEDQYVAAALELFAAVALMFWYILRILMSRK
ncbi:MAG: Bax inhibitor-1 family protein [Verrucomicrobiota bacterium]|nr:Bax inhibitor-1 family protein [Verrucomicrobiota bacterium]